MSQTLKRKAPSVRQVAAQQGKARKAKAAQERKVSRTHRRWCRRWAGESACPTQNTDSKMALDTAASSVSIARSTS